MNAVIRASSIQAAPVAYSVAGAEIRILPFVGTLDAISNWLVFWNRGKAFIASLGSWQGDGPRFNAAELCDLFRHAALSHIDCAARQ